MNARRHRSFRLSPPDYMVGRRVVPRLRWVHLGVWAVRLACIVGGMIGYVYLVGRIPAIQPQSDWGLLGSVGHYVVILLMNSLGFRIGKLAMLRGGALHADEAACFESWMSQWPETWLEDLPQASGRSQSSIF